MTTTTIHRLREWVEWWRGAGDLADKGPRRPRDVDAYDDKELKRAAQTIARIERGRGR